MAALALFGAGSVSAGSEEVNLRKAEVHPTLIEQLQAKPTDGVTAVITAWGRDGLDEIEATGVKGQRLRVLPMVITDTLTQAQLDQLADSPAVRSIWPEQKFETHMEDTTWITKARYVWSSSPSSGPLKGYGITGKGIELAMIDTGFDGLHEDGDNLIEFCDTTGAATATGQRRDVRCTPWDADFNDAPAGACGLAHGPDPTGPLPPVGGAPPSTGPCANPARGDSQDPDVAHGTHVGGTMVGTGHASGGKGFTHSTIGMAPNSKLRAYSANVGASLLATQILSAYDDMTYKKEQGYSKVIAVNNSWGGSGGSNYNPNDPQHVAFKRAYDAGIVSVFSAGNSGPEHNTLGAQCVSPWVVCVAANTKPDQIVAFSSKGRPSQPSDTNRDGKIDAGDVPPDNHDRLLGQRLDLGVYRPTLTAPGVAINSMAAIAASIGTPGSLACREDFLISEDVNAQCYAQAQGTSMSAPHVTGAIGLIGEAFRQERGRVPSPAEIIDILERSANSTKLPGWEAEEQGAGRLDVYQAVRLAKREITLRRPNFGHPTPPYISGSYGSSTTIAGCTGTGSWTLKDSPTPGDLGPGPVVPGVTPPTGPRYGQHFITVLPNTERLRITMRWPAHPTANLYALLWRPGVNPDTLAPTPDAGPPPAYPGRPPAFFHNRAFPDQEATGLPTGLPPTYRLIEVRAPEETDVSSPSEGGPPPTIPSGKWVLRVYHRAGGVGDTCNPSSQETPKQVEGFDYTLQVERPRVTYRPSVKITSPLTGTQSQRFVPIEGRAGYPPHTQRPPGVEEPTAPPLGHVGYSWEGITNWEVPGSATGSSGGEQGEPDPDTRTVLYMHGNDHETSEPGEAGCSGKGETDVFVIGCGPFLLPDPLSPKPVAANFGPVNAVLNGTNDRSPYDPNWVWCLDVDPDGCPAPPIGGSSRPGPTTVEGPMTVEWWASTAPAGGTPGAFTMGWTIRVWADDVLRYQSSRIEATPETAGVPDRLKAVVTLPRITATRKFVVHVDANELDTDQEATFVYYDSQSRCTPAALSGPCDSLVKMPVVANGGGSGGSTGQPATPENVRVTDLPANPPANHPYPTSQPLSPALRVAWDAQSPAPARYEVYRSTDPAFTNGGTRVYSGAGTPCISPQSPNGQDDPNGHDRSGMCYTDTSVGFGTVYYYRVLSVVRQNNADRRSSASGIAYGMPTRYDRQVRLKVDRLYGPQVWEHALVPPSPTPPDTTNTGVNWEYLWDTLELTGMHRVFARSFTQGIGSTKDGKNVPLDDDPGDPGPGTGPGCPDDDDGDGDDDADDGDADDDGDDSDDDCEDDSDDSEDDDD